MGVKEEVRESNIGLEIVKEVSKFPKEGLIGRLSDKEKERLDLMRSAEGGKMECKFRFGRRMA